MEILTKKVTRVEEVTEDVTINLPDEIFTFQRYNYRELVKVIPVTLKEEGIIGYKFIMADKTGIVHKKYWLSGIISLMRGDIERLDPLEKIVVWIIRDVDEDIKRDGSYLDHISEEEFNEEFNGIFMDILKTSEIDMVKIRTLIGERTK